MSYNFNPVKKLSSHILRRHNQGILPLIGAVFGAATAAGLTASAADYVEPPPIAMEDASAIGPSVIVVAGVGDLKIM